MTSFNIFMLFSVSYKTVPHYLMMNLSMYVCAYDISNREHLHMCREFLEGYTKNC